MRVAIIGSAGRSGSWKGMTPLLYRNMVEIARHLIEERAASDEAWEWGNIELVSGGAAWSDHVAISLFLTKGIAGFPLVLHLPAKFDDETERYAKDAVGGVANFHHENFSERLTIDSKGGIDRGASLRTIASIINRDDVFVYVTPGFKERNAKIAEDAEAVIAFTDGVRDTPSSRGTKHCWGLIDVPPANKVHVSLFHLER